MFQTIVFTLIFCANIIGTSQTTLVVSVDYGKPLHFLNPKFLSVTIDSDFVKWKFPGFNFTSEKLQNLAKALSPCDVRLGGTYADFLIFDPDGEETTVRGWTNLFHNSVDSRTNMEVRDGNGQSRVNFTMTGHQWDVLVNFFTLAGWDVMFDFNLFLWNGSLWDPTNAEAFLRYSAIRGYPLHAFQLGNEPNSFHYNFNFTISPDTLAKDFRILRSILYRYPQYMKNKLYGPDVTDLSRHSSSRIYLQDFVKAGGNKVVDEISLHQYYMNGRTAKVADFYSLWYMDKMKTEIHYGHMLSGGSRIRLTETSSCYGSGAPGLSDRYVAGFLWLDKLGLAAKYGVTSVFRQTFYGGHYALISNHLEPNPDYFLTLLFKRLIDGNVFNATMVPDNKHLRLYAHCTKESKLYKKGALTFAYLNTINETMNMKFDQFAASTLHLYILTPGDHLGLKSSFVKLNGQVLKMSGSLLPPLPPKVWKDTVKLPPLSFGFIVVPDAKIPACIK